MKSKWWVIVLMLVLVGAAGLADGQENSDDVSLIAPDLSNFSWGRQVASFDVTNHTDYLRFIVIKQYLTLVGQSQTIHRTMTKNEVLWPGETRTIDAVVNIPGIFGTGNLYIGLYDVVDTLDELFDGYDIFQRNIPLSFPIPDGLAGLAQDKLAVPPRVDVGMDFGSDFPKLMLKLLAEGDTPSDIVKISECRESFVLETIDSMVHRKFLAETPDGPKLTMPYISAEHGEKVLTRIAPTVRKVADIITENFTSYPTLIDSLVKAGAVTKDSNDFIDPGTVIYRRYVMTVPFLLWYDLGQEFISNPSLLTVFPQSDPCNAWSPQYMYLADQGDRFAGTQYYFLKLLPRRPMKIVFADHTPELDCPDQFWEMPDKQLQEQVHWNYPQVDRPENFLIDTAKVHLALRRLRKGLPELVADLKKEANAMGQEAGADRNQYGYRYWFWNLFATNVTNELIQRGVLIRPGNGNLRFEVFSE
jgi:hypothetical protein